MRTRGLKSLVAGLVCALLVPAQAADSREPELLVFAAASLTDVLAELGSAWSARSRIPVKFSFAATSVLARQIEAGGRAQVFVAADQAWMDYLAARGLLREATRTDVAGNRLVLIAPADSKVMLEPVRGLRLAPALGRGRLAVAEPDTVPAGRYARDALITLGAWQEVATRLVRAENVRTALSYVARGEAPLGIVYSTDAQIDTKVRVVATFPDNSHAPITYPAAAIAGAGPEADVFVRFLASADAASTWKKHGFRELSK